MSDVIYEASMESCFSAGRMFPPGFRFHPTDEELVLYYLKRKICRRRLRLDVITETDVYKWDPEDLPGLSKLKTGDRQWFFLSRRDRKYPNGARSNRATLHGYWKATGKDRIITCNSHAVGVKKTLVFYKGRAPSKERTDWVMHEYTLDEDELKRCPAVHDYYALYKVYKKSGPGPKNGEQYGALFREEDWVDDDCFAVKNMENPATPSNELVPVDCPKNNVQVEYCLNDLEDLMNQIVDDAPLIQPLPVEYSLEQLMGEEEPQSTLADSCSKEHNVGGRSTIGQPQFKQCDVQASVDETQSGTSQLHEPPEVSSAPNPSSHSFEPLVIEDDFFKDFLEVDDLIGPEPTTQDFSLPAQGGDKAAKDPVNQLDELGAYDLFQDSGLFLSETGLDELGQILQENDLLPDAQRQVPNPYLNRQVGPGNEPGHLSHLGGYHDMNGMLSPVSQSHLYNFENETASLQQMQPNESNQYAELWRHDQRSSVFTPMESNQGTIPTPASGVVYDYSSGNHPTGSSNHNRDMQQDGGRNSWFSSALWSFVESIPTTPASAAESPLVNKAFERMSSFSRLRVSSCSSRNTNVTAPAATSFSGKSKNRLILFSLLGLLCAVLWVSLET